MEFATINDTHWGVRNDDQNFANHFKRFYEEVFFPTLLARGVKHIVHLGDIVDRRKYINFLSARRMREDFIEKCVEYGITLHIILGNHDVYYKNTNKVNAMNELNYDKYPNIFIYQKPTEINIGGLDILLMPWISPENYEESISAVNNTKAKVLFGHLELSGFAMYKGIENEHGLSPSLFSKLDEVYSGHYHHKSSKGNIHYLGAPYQITWSDIYDDRGFHIYNTSNRIIEYIKNPNDIFYSIVYNDEHKSIDEVVVDVSQYKNCFVRLVVETKENPLWFDMLIDKFEAIGVLDLKIIDERDRIYIDTDKFEGESSDTLSILNSVIGQLDVGVKHAGLVELFVELHNEALGVE